MSYGAVQSVDGEHAIANVTLGSALVGAPDRAHGGIVAALFDEIMGMVPPMHGHLAFTGWLRVDYVQPCPIGIPLEFRAWHDSTDGRKISVLGEARRGDDDAVFATSSGLFISAKSA